MIMLGTGAVDGVSMASAKAGVIRLHSAPESTRKRKVCKSRRA